MTRATTLALGCVLTLAASTIVHAQTQTAAASGEAAPVNDQAAQDRIMELVRTGKCGPAKTEALRVGDTSLADQIGTMCGAHSSNPFPTKGGGGRSGGSGRGSGSGRPGPSGG